MANMSYCRFQNTLTDLLDCYRNMDDDDLDEYETEARTALISLCIDIADEYGDEATEEYVGEEEEEDEE